MGRLGSGCALVHREPEERGHPPRPFPVNGFTYILQTSPNTHILHLTHSSSYWCFTPKPIYYL